MIKKVIHKLQNKSKPYLILDVLSLISAVLTILTFLYGVYKVFSQDNGEDLSIKNIQTIINFIFLCMLVVCGFKIKKYGILIRNIKKTFSENYYRFLHDFRNYHFDILNSHKCKDYEVSIEELTKDAKKYSEKVLDCLCNILESSTGEKVSACIKLIENSGMETGIDKEKATVITFCRSSNSDGDRKAGDGTKSNEGIPIRGNTDFYNMLTEGSSDFSVFYHGDLIKYDEDLQNVGNSYKNTTENYKKFYKGTIVAPIRINNQYLFYKNLSNGYDIIGFLCVDSLSTSAFRETEFEKTVNKYIVKSFAAEMYVALNKYNYYLKKVKVDK